MLHGNVYVLFKEWCPDVSFMQFVLAGDFRDRTEQSGAAPATCIHMTCRAVPFCISRLAQSGYVRLAGLHFLVGHAVVIPHPFPLGRGKSVRRVIFTSCSRCNFCNILQYRFNVPIEGIRLERHNAFGGRN